MTFKLKAYLSSVSAPFQLSVIGNNCKSSILNSLTLNVGLKIAHCRVHPRALASSALSVVLGSLPNTSVIIDFIAGMRVEPPTISIKSISSGLSSLNSFI